jgi:protein-tyrosine sulfotransferase
MFFSKDDNIKLIASNHQLKHVMRLPRNRRTVIVGGLVVFTLVVLMVKTDMFRPACLFSREDESVMVREEKFVQGSNHKSYVYHRNMPLVFIGGVPRSGTTLMRAMLDAHPEVRCGQETRVIPRILQLRSHWMKSEKESMRLEEAGIHKEVLNSAIAQFCLEIIAKHGDPAPRLCNKDPLTLKMGTYVIELFPNVSLHSNCSCLASIFAFLFHPQAKFLFMVRDGRATVHSIISRKVTITGFDLTNYRQCMTKWNQAITTMHDQCQEIGKERCLMVSTCLPLRTIVQPLMCV